MTDRRGALLNLLATGIAAGASNAVTPANQASEELSRAIPTTGAVACSGQIFSVRTYGARGDGVADDGPAVQRTIVAALAAGGGIVFFPAGDYRVTGIDATNADPDQFDVALRMIGEGRHLSRIVAGAPGTALLDISGRNNLYVEGLQFLAHAHVARCAVLLARTPRSQNCNNNQFVDCLFIGNYGEATILSYAAESTSWDRCRFLNSNAQARYCCFVTGPGHRVSAASRAATHVGPNTDNVMVDCEFYAPFEGARPVRFEGGGGYTFVACAVLCGSASNVRLVSYGAPIDGVFNGPITWTACHFEVFGRANVAHWLDGAGLSYFRGIAIDGGAMMVAADTPLLDFDRRTANVRPVLQSARIAAPLLPPGVVAGAVRVHAATSSRIDLRYSPEIGALTIFDFARDCTLEAARSSIGQVIGSPVTLASAGLPTRGSVAAGMRIYNLDARTGQPSGWQVAAGGAGTFAGGTEGEEGSGPIGPIKAVGTVGNGTQLAGAGAGRLAIGDRVLLGTARRPAYVRDLDGEIAWFDPPMSEKGPVTLRTPELVALAPFGGA